MKIQTLPFLLLLSTLAFSQTKEKISLEWKIPKNDTLKYKTTMNVIRLESEVSNTNDSTSIFSGEAFEKIKESLSEFNSDIKYQTNLFVNKNDEKQIDVEMLMFNDEEDNAAEKLKEMITQLKVENQKEGKKKKSKDKIDETEEDSLSFKNLYKDLVKLNGNVVLRGRITTGGEIISTYYKNAQKNLLSVLFELPNRKVEIGEKWKLNISLIEMDQNFVCDSLSKENAVHIEEIIEKEGEKIAVIKYNISEYVIGDFNNPMGGLFGIDSNKKTFMKISHIATGYFSILQGKWINYEGTMEIESNFSMFGGKSKTEFKLIE
ncbi:MAG TPA: hypothetical protein PLL09_15340 [Flavobacterium sp.]|uniref:hypothetical protein n=1 Tax=unclassified Flavobacterium TaxID=196869 RepID=UPI0025C0FD0E|nr:MULTISPECIES: hypothetical protein [unclassified Flavobacterium]HRE79190.1 hypothetical protein [Flavobacterium sp.]